MVWPLARKALLVNSSGREQNRDTLSLLCSPLRRFKEIVCSHWQWKQTRVAFQQQLNESVKVSCTTLNQGRKSSLPILISSNCTLPLCIVQCCCRVAVFGRGLGVWFRIFIHKVRTTSILYVCKFLGDHLWELKIRQFANNFTST